MAMISFTTDKIKVRKGEDEMINPGCYGINLAKDIRNSLRDKGYQAKAGTEDWGWYIVIKRKPYFQWVGCSNISDITTEIVENPSSMIEWGINIVNECGLWHRFTNTANVKTETDRLMADVKEIILNRYGIAANDE